MLPITRLAERRVRDRLEVLGGLANADDFMPTQHVKAALADSHPNTDPGSEPQLADIPIVEIDHLIEHLQLIAPVPVAPHRPFRVFDLTLGLPPSIDSAHLSIIEEHPGVTRL